jgi:DNA primase
MAGMIPETKIDEVRNSVNIADYVGQYVQLHNAGQNLFGICPFHDENTPSFSVNESKQIFKCFSCGRGGNVFSFVQQYDKVSFPEAVEKVAEFAHIDLGITVQANRAPVDPEVAAQIALLKKITDMCHHILVNTQAGEKALAYLTDRGLTRETIDHFDIGYAPKDRTLMRTFLDQQQVDYATQRASGLFVEDDQATLYDRFNDRVMFPLKDASGNVIGFSGRVLDKASHQAKYLNSPETKLFNKRDVLFNLDAAKTEFKQFGAAVLFEGFMDVIAAYQAGVPVGIASMGTSLTQDQVNIIAKQTRQLTICYDGDEPGQNATARALTLVQNHKRLQTNVVVLPDGMDPDEYIKARGADAFKQQVQTVLTPTAFALHHDALGLDMTNDADKLQYLDAALKTVALVPAGAEQAVYLQQISQTTGVAVNDLKVSLPQTAPQQVAPQSDYAPWPDVAPPPMPDEYGQTFAGPVSPAPQQHFDKFEQAERQLLAYAWIEPAVAARLHQSNFQFGHAQYQSLFDAWVSYAAATNPPQFAGYLDHVPADLVALATNLSEQTYPEPDDDVIEELIALAGKEDAYAQLQQVKAALHQAQVLGDKAGATQLGMQYIQLLRAYKTGSVAE